MNARQLRQMCKTHNLKVRGRKDEVLARLKRTLTTACEGGKGSQADDDCQADDDSQADSESDDKTDSTFVEDTAGCEDSSPHVRRRLCREVTMPERYSPQSSVHDDAESDSAGVSLDDDASVHSLSSDSSEARSIVAANKRRRADLLFRSSFIE